MRCLHPMDLTEMIPSDHRSRRVHLEEAMDALGVLSPRLPKDMPVCGLWETVGRVAKGASWREDHDWNMI